MAKTIARSRDPGLYDRDFSLWLERQVELLRSGRFSDLDLDNLIEEIESLGRKEKQEVESRAELVLVHLLKLAFSPASEPRRGWLRTVMIQRRALARMLSATLRAHLQEQLADVHGQARRMAAVEMETDAVEPDILPQECPFTLDEILEQDWLPQNVHDLDRDHA
jgi:Domain of unknown function DUF29